MTHSEIRYYLPFAALGFIFAAHGVVQTLVMVRDATVGIDYRIISVLIVVLLFLPNMIFIAGYHANPKPIEENRELTKFSL